MTCDVIVKCVCVCGGNTAHSKVSVKTGLGGRDRESNSIYPPMILGTNIPHTFKPDVDLRSGISAGGLIVVPRQRNHQGNRRPGTHGGRKQVGAAGGHGTQINLDCKACAMSPLSQGFSNGTAFVSIRRPLTWDDPRRSPSSAKTERPARDGVLPSTVSVPDVFQIATGDAVAGKAGGWSAGLIVPGHSRHVTQAKMWF